MISIEENRRGTAGRVVPLIVPEVHVRCLALIVEMLAFPKDARHSRAISKNIVSSTTGI